MGAGNRSTRNRRQRGPTEKLHRVMKKGPRRAALGVI
jgi:hypothetical protein